MKARVSTCGSLAAELPGARRFFLAALEEAPEGRWGERPSPAYSPTGWHVGHVASMQARWLLPGEKPRYGEMFDPFQTAKPARGELPPPSELRAYLEEVFDRVASLDLPDTFLVQHIAQHELQHAEHVRVISALLENRLHRMPAPLKLRPADRIEMPGGRVQVGGADASRAYDNERPRHEIELRPYWLDPAPVTAGQFVQFVRAVKDPEIAPLGLDEQNPDAPVTCVSWNDCDAYARWRGARLPTEHELEAANIPPSGVWEWTASWFLPYPGFRPYPYEGYSVPWFGTHRVLRGGSWATSPDLVRPSLRNWYEPGLREIPSGFRLAGDL
jgi:formylglycine-generating enzyme required for sulfatase activity